MRVETLSAFRHVTIAYAAAHRLSANFAPPLRRFTDGYSSTGSNSSLPTPHRGQVQSSGISSNLVPGAIPPSGSPTAGSYIQPHTTQRYFFINIHSCFYSGRLCFYLRQSRRPTLFCRHKDNSSDVFLQIVFFDNATSSAYSQPVTGSKADCVCRRSANVTSVCPYYNICAAAWK